MTYDATLLASASGGDEHAIATLLATAHPDIRRYARRSCATTSDVEDAVQEVMMILHRRMPTVGKLRSISGWLFVVAHRACLRLSSPRLGAASVDLPPLVHIGATEAADLRIDLARAIQSLPAHYRAVLILRDVEELTIDEIASRLTTTRETVKARLRRARRLVREYLV